MTDNLSNRDVANVWISHVLGKLYEEWPRRCDFDWMAVGNKTGVDVRTDPDQLFDDTMRWLLNNDYIRYGGQSAGEDSWLDVELTEKGYLVLGSTPDSLKEPLGKRLSVAAGEAGSDIGRQTVGALIGAMVGAAFKTISN